MLKCEVFFFFFVEKIGHNKPYAFQVQIVVQIIRNAQKNDSRSAKFQGSDVMTSHIPHQPKSQILNILSYMRIKFVCIFFFFFRKSFLFFALSFQCEVL